MAVRPKNWEAEAGARLQLVGGFVFRERVDGIVPEESNGFYLSQPDIDTLSYVSQLDWLQFALLDEPDDDVLQAISRISSLRSLTVYDSTASEVGFRSMAPCKGLESLRISNGAINLKVARAIATIASLRSVDLIGTALEGDACFRELARLERLTELRLFELKITDRAMTYLKTHPTLEVLGILDTPLGDAGLLELAEAPSLKQLSSTPTRSRRRPFKSSEGVRLPFSFR